MAELPQQQDKTPWKDDTFPSSECHGNWSVEQTCQWLNSLNPNFGQYCGRLKELKIGGTRWHKLRDVKFLREKICTGNPSHAQAICDAAQSREDKYCQVDDDFSSKIEAVYDAPGSFVLVEKEDAQNSGYVPPVPRRAKSPKPVAEEPKPGEHYHAPHKFSRHKYKRPGVQRPGVQIPLNDVPVAIPEPSPERSPEVKPEPLPESPKSSETFPAFSQEGSSSNIRDIKQLLTEEIRNNPQLRDEVMALLDPSPKKSEEPGSNDDPYPYESNDSDTEYVSEAPVYTDDEVYDLSGYEDPPRLPFLKHPPPSMKDMSNKFRLKGPNRILYPPKNGPRARAKQLKMDESKVPRIDPQDELTKSVIEQYRRNFNEDLRTLHSMGFRNEYQNIRGLLRHNILDPVIDELRNLTIEGIYIGDRVERGPDWKWGDQDGGNGLFGTVRGLRQWHPRDKKGKLTSVVVLWDMGLYGNYRFGYRGAFDVKVVERFDKLPLVTVGERVKRAVPNWRWGDQDGGTKKSFGTVLEVYASPAPFEGGARIAVLWDKDRQVYREKALRYKEQRQMKKLDEEEEKEVHLLEHQRMEESENESDWDEPDFEEVLSKPMPKYRWGLQEIFYDLQISRPAVLRDEEFLMIDDRVSKGPDFEAPDSSDYSNPHPIVLKVEQWDPTRVNPHEIRGDKVYVTWSTKHGFRFNYNGYMDITFKERGHIFREEMTRIRVGDRVKRGFMWDCKLYGNEDGGEGSEGTVVALQYVLQIAGVLVKVQWDRTQHTNMYSWGFKDIFDVETIEPGL